MKTVYYHLSAYISHRTAGLAYIRAMRQAGIPLAPTPDDADVVVLHDDPLNYPIILAKHPEMRHKERIGYCVWETETLPGPYIEPLKLVDAIWTCSPFSRQAFAARFPDVALVPHIVEPPDCSPEDLDRIRQTLHYSNDAYYFYTIVDSVNPRKNLSGLLTVFLKNFLNEKNVFLVVKQYRHSLDLTHLKNVIPLNDDLTPSQMSALHSLCHCGVSMHHAEAWGLSLSEALSHGNPVIATGYSGNMTYMNADNSFPVNFTLTPVSDAACQRIPLFTKAMRWAKADAGHFGYLMRKVRRLGEDSARRQRVMDSMRPFRAAAIARILAELLT